ncbi:serine hydrolase domain-containing protein [Devosia salina]|uniref:Beta-lactamase family protein n=1 Tax=Devosia salina TaxID=2860336 RepID=A0ABX8WJT9_9HYPH|nr:serine hydrolase domain-containing protein [Devosia salina]QYO78274.1 beta-lactamase family protein [Devosia salina]
MGAQVDAVMDGAIAARKIVGAELIVYHHGQITLRRTAGHFDREAGVPMAENAIYRLASVTKPIVAATALAMIDKGLLRLDDPVSRHLPYFTPALDDGKPAPISIHHLLTHTAGLAYGYPDDPEISTGLAPSDKGFEENFSRVAKQKLLFAPGTAWSYSVAIDVLGAALAAIHGGSLESAVRTHVTGPLGLAETGFFVADMARLAKPYADGTPPVPMADPHAVPNDRGELVTFSPSRIFSDKAFQSGGAGMAGTPSDIARFLEAMRTGGGGAVKPETLDLAFSNRIGSVHRDDAGQRFGYLGAIVDDPVAANSPAAKGTINWGGVYGHSWLVDRANALTIVSMSNTALEGCTGQYPKDLIRAVYADLF